jgi:hypothetical protein
MTHTTTPAARVRSLLVAAAAITTLALAASGCGSESATESSPNSGDPNGSRNAANGLIGEWVAENRCEDLVRALREAGLDAYIGRMLTGQYRDETPRQIARDRNPCRGATSFEHSHAFERDGGFASYDDTGQQVDQGVYETSGDTLTLTRPPFDVTVQYRITGDEATFELQTPPDCRTKHCRDSVALGVGTFFPRTYKRVD